ncbi:hypothetical protein TNCV_3954631 [Trichonephila clavipes]|nr:hypothetical protein TNCV_3954631 [Trichonephila clavipes]
MEIEAHINIRQSGDWFRPLQSGEECDQYFTSSGKLVNETRKDRVGENSGTLKRLIMNTPKKLENSICEEHCGRGSRVV